jgi:hypothetical protein
MHVPRFTSLEPLDRGAVEKLRAEGYHAGMTAVDRPKQGRGRAR